MIYTGRASGPRKPRMSRGRWETMDGIWEVEYAASATSCGDSCEMRMRTLILTNRLRNCIDDLPDIA